MLAPLHRPSRLLFMGSQPVTIYIIPDAWSDGYCQGPSAGAPDATSGPGTGSAYVFLGKGTSGTEWFKSGFRWSNVQIPQGKHVVSAKMRTCAAAGFINLGVNVKIRGGAQDNVARFNTKEDIWNSPRTVAEVAWNPGAWPANTWMDTPELAALVQEIVDRPGWVAGNALSIYWDCTTSSSNYKYVWGMAGTENTKVARLLIQL